MSAGSIGPTNPIVPPDPDPLDDAALRSAFGADVRPTALGARGPKVVALQYTLGRLGYDAGLADGVFGRKTEAALRAFQRGAGLPETGAADAATLAALDRALAAHDPRTPAARAADPIAFLSDFRALGLSPIAISDRSRPIDWAHPEIQAAYGRFVTEYWPVLKHNRVECDCKTLALFFMDQFRKKVKADLHVELPLPGSRDGRIPRATWSAATAARPGGWFSRTEDLPRVRPGYAAARNIEALDPRHSMLYGVNVRYAGVDANGVARAAHTTVAWDSARDNRGDRRRAEVPVNALAPGDLVFIDHEGDRRFDHTVNVVAVERDAAGRARRLTLAVGSYDHMLDADAATRPGGLGEVNNYCEEVEVALNEDGTIASSRVTWSSEPAHVHDSRYSAATTLMELAPGGLLKVARWGNPR